jgi:hypothetical protein
MIYFFMTLPDSRCTSFVLAITGSCLLIATNNSLGLELIMLTS